MAPAAMLFHVVAEQVVSESECEQIIHSSMRMDLFRASDDTAKCSWPSGAQSWYGFSNGDSG